MKTDKKGGKPTHLVQTAGSESAFLTILNFFRFWRRSPDDVRLIKNLKGILGFKPGKLAYYRTALIHRSASVIDKNNRVVNNERLEYLGDAILDAAVADYLYHKYPGESEGFLTQLRSRIVNGEKLSEIAVEIGLNHLIVSNTSRPQAKKNLNGDALEAIIGAIYLDKGYRYTARFVVHKILRRHVDLMELANTDTNYKSQLIEWAQREKREVNFDTREHPEDIKNFISYVLVGTERMGQGQGTSKKIAEQEAAKATLEQLGAL